MGVPALQVDAAGHCAGPPSGAVQGAMHKPDIPEFSAGTVSILPPTDTEAD